MAFHIIQAQHSSPIIVVAAFVFVLYASAQLELDHLKVGKETFVTTDLMGSKCNIHLVVVCE